MGRRVLRVITRLNIGGPARQALLLTRELADEYPTTLVAGTPAADEGELTDGVVEVHRAPLVRSVSPRDDARAAAALLRHERHLRPALIHTHMAKAGTLGRLTAELVRPRPVRVHTFHGHVLEGYFGRAAERTFLETERLLARRTDALVAVSAQTRDALLELGIGRPEQWRVVPLGLDLDSHLHGRPEHGLLRRRFGVAADAPLVGIVGRLVSIKDPSTLFHAIQRLDGVHLAVVGDGELRQELECLAVGLGIGNRVHFAGWMLDIPAVMADLDVVALTSRNEGTPVALIEAAACGRAVVATDVGGVGTVVEDGVTGLLVPPGDPTELAAALQTLLGDADRRATMGAAGRVRAERFTGDRLVRDIRQLYDELLG